MKKYLCAGVSSILLTTLLSLSSGCKKNTVPDTCVRPMPDTAYVGQILTFQSCTQNATTVVWNFGDGTNATTATATHAYAAGGTYTVTFTPLNSIGTGTPKTFTITVTYPGPAACIAALPDSAYIGQTLNFASCTQGATSYLWNFGDGGTANTATATHAYTNPGIYTGSLTASDARGAGNPQPFTIIVTVDGGSWTFQNVTYKTADCYASTSSLLASSQTSSNSLTYGTLIFSFHNGVPTTSGTYDVVYSSSMYLPTQVSIYMTTNGVNDEDYFSMDGTHQTVQVTVTNGRASISGSNITMQTSYNSSITAPVSFNITKMR